MPSSEHIRGSIKALFRPTVARFIRGETKYPVLTGHFLMMLVELRSCPGYVHKLYNTIPELATGSPRTFFVEAFHAWVASKICVAYGRADDELRERADRHRRLFIAKYTENEHLIPTNLNDRNWFASVVAYNWDKAPEKLQKLVLKHVEKMRYGHFRERAFVILQIRMIVGRDESEATRSELLVVSEEETRKLLAQRTEHTYWIDPARPKSTFYITCDTVYALLQAKAASMSSVEKTLDWIETQICEAADRPQGSRAEMSTTELCLAIIVLFLSGRLDQAAVSWIEGIVDQHVGDDVSREQAMAHDAYREGRDVDALRHLGSAAEAMVNRAFARMQYIPELKVNPRAGTQFQRLQEIRSARREIRKLVNNDMIDRLDISLSLLDIIRIERNHISHQGQVLCLDEFVGPLLDMFEQSRAVFETVFAKSTETE